jgi:hypothetical protein
MLRKITLGAALTIAATALAVPAPASTNTAEATQALPVQVLAKPDPQVKAGHDPYVLFSVTGATVGQKYRITQVTGPRSDGRCMSALTTEWQLAFKGGKVVFDLEPVTSGKYDDVLRWSPCRGTYTLKLERRATSASQPTVRRFSFAYPSFKIRYLSLRP